MKNFVEIKFEKSTEQEYLALEQAYRNAMSKCEACLRVEFGACPCDPKDGYIIDCFIYNGKIMYALNLDRFDDAGNITYGYVPVFTSNKKVAQSWARHYGYKKIGWSRK